ncbi:hypothetical protein MU0083_000571 [[Mycobacterium] kokjensenii]|uniref:Secreted protein n=1 Tax=[Mycobacterium] kokjensenii TaxID=3064287 RepID=A0ABM9L7E5_9MYCO|nr:hypothetical protein [Mycolicibacter sp. MU0083]CAJ1493942.1 hypothetical protein MU0083_000571 [Mycolicibacter sp. MU0083]
MEAVLTCVLVILVCGGFALVHDLRVVRAGRQDRERIRDRADKQHHWVLTGDDRGVYGAGGAALMRHVTEPPELDEIVTATVEPTEVAAVAHTAEALAALIAEKPACWRYAVFVSVLVQRRAQVQSRLRDQELGYCATRGPRIHHGFALGQYLADLLQQVAVLVGQIEELMLSPGFVRMFGDPYDGDTADAGAIVHAAHRLMDLHENLLDLAERCRGVDVLAQHSEVVRDCARVIDAPLEGYRNFIDEFVERIDELPEVLRYARGHIDMGAIMLTMDDSGPLFQNAFNGLRKLAAGR